MIIAFVILCILATVLFCPVCVEVSYLLYKSENKFTLSAGIIRPFIKFGSKKPKAEKCEEKEKSDAVKEKNKKKMSFEAIKNIISEVIVLFTYFKRYLVIKKLKLHFHIGADDAAVTGIATGAAWGALYDTVAVIDNNFTLKDKNIHVCPNFTEKVFETDICVRVSIKIWYLLIFAIKTYKAVKKLELI